MIKKLCQKIYGDDYVLILAKAILAFMIGFILTIIFGLFVIPILKKLKIKQVTSSYVLKHKSKSGTPTMGGIIFIIPTIISIFILDFISAKVANS